MLAFELAGTLCVSDMAGQLGITQLAATQHIKSLESIGFLIEEKIGFRVYCNINNRGLMVCRIINILYHVTWRRYIAWYRIYPWGGLAYLPGTKPLPSFVFLENLRWFYKSG